MNIFQDTTFKWWQIGLFKFSLLAIGIAIGAYWQEIFLPYITCLVILGLALALYISIVWYKQH